MGVISALSALKESCTVTLTTDSKYVVDSITKGWVYGWQKNGWIKSDKKPALNVDLWEKLMPLLARHEVTFVWVKGHAGHPENERCDELAVMESKKFCKQEKRVVANYYVVSVLSVEHSGEYSAALDYSNVYYDEERAVDEARFLANRDGVLQVIVYKWNLHDDGTGEPCDDGYVFSWKEGEEKPSIDMFVKLEMEAEDCCEEVVCLSRPEIKAVQKFIKAVGHRGFCWQGGHWTVSDPCATEDEAWDVDMSPFVKELDCGALMSVQKFLHRMKG